MTIERKRAKYRNKRNFIYPRTYLPAVELIVWLTMTVDLALHLGLKSQRAAKPTLHPSFEMVDECTPEEDGEGKSMVTQVSYWLAGSLSPQPPRAKGRRGTPPQSSATAYE